MCIRESHQNADVFREPELFNPDRFIGRNFTRAEYAPFGTFRLACVGEDVVKTVAARFALELVAGFEWRVVDDGPPEINSWAHIAPSLRFSVKVAAKASAGAR